VRFARQDFERNKGVEDIVSLFSVAGWRRVIWQLDGILYCVMASYIPQDETTMCHRLWNNKNLCFYSSRTFQWGFCFG